MGCKEKFLKNLSLICGFTIFLVGLVFLISWHIGYTQLLTVFSRTWPLPYVAAMGYCLAGLAMMALFSSWQFPISRILGGVIFGVSLLRLLEIVLGHSFGIGFVVKTVLQNPSIQVPPNALMGVIGFLLVGFLLLFWARKRTTLLRSNAILLLSFTVFFIGCFTLLSKFLPLKPTLGWEESIPIHFYTSLAMLVLGIGLISARIYFDIQAKVVVNQWFPVVAVTSVLIFTLMVVLGFNTEKESLIKTLVIERAKVVQKQILDSFKNETDFLDQMAGRLEYAKMAPAESWANDVTILLRERKELKAVVWTDPNFTIQKIIPPVREESELFKDLVLSPEQKEQINIWIKEKKRLLGVNLQNKNLLISRAVYWDGQLQGFLMGLIDGPQFFEEVAKELLNKSFGITIRSENREIYRLDEGLEKQVDFSSYQETFTLQTLKLTVVLTATPVLFAENLGVQTLYILLLGGVLFAVTIGWLIHLWQVSNRRILLVEKAEADLKGAEENLNFILSSAKIGTWEWDPLTNEMKGGEVSDQIFGVKAGEINNYSTFIEHVHSDDRQLVKEKLSDTYQKNRPLSHTFRIVWPDGSLRFVNAKGRTAFNEQKQLVKVMGLCWDVTDMVRSQRLLQVSEGISRSLTESDTLKEAVNKTLTILNELLGWDVLIIWQYKGLKKSLKCLEMAHIPSIQIPLFEEMSRKLSEYPGQSIPNQVVTTYRPLAVRDLSQESHFVRSKVAEKEGIKGVLAFPIFSGSSLEGVFEVLKREPFTEEMNEGLLNLMTTLGIEVGQFLHRQEAEKARSELAAIVTYSANAIYSLDFEGIVKNWNLGAEKIYGWAAEDMIGHSIKKIYPSNRDSDFESVVRMLREGAPVTRLQTERLCKNGSMIWVDNTYSLVRDDNGHPIAISVVAENINEQKKRDTLLQASEERFHGFVDLTDEWIWEIDRKASFTYSNKSVAVILGYLPEEIIGKEIYAFISKESRDSVQYEIENCLEKKRGWDRKLAYWISKKGAAMPMESIGEPILDEHKELVGFRVVNRDLSEKIALEKSKNEFTSLVSHELRTPLTSIHGALGLLSSLSDVPEKAKELIYLAYRNSEKLTQIINDILDAEKIQIGFLKLQMRPVVLADVVKEGVEFSKKSIQGGQVTIVQEEPFPNVKALGDYERIVQVMHNLLSNAIKFSPDDGKIFVSMTVDNDEVKVSIRDLGPGIPLAMQSKMFMPYTQVDSSDTRSVGGTGLGLAISKKMIEQMNGKIGFTTKEGEGTTFFFTLPILKVGEKDDKKGA